MQNRLKQQTILVKNQFLYLNSANLQVRTPLQNHDFKVPLQETLDSMLQTACTYE